MQMQLPMNHMAAQNGAERLQWSGGSTPRKALSVATTAWGMSQTTQGGPPYNAGTDPRLYSNNNSMLSYNQQPNATGFSVGSPQKPSYNSVAYNRGQTTPHNQHNGFSSPVANMSHVGGGVESPDSLSAAAMAAATVAATAAASMDERGPQSVHMNGQYGSNQMGVHSQQQQQFGAAQFVPGYSNCYGARQSMAHSMHGPPMNCHTRSPVEAGGAPMSCGPAGLQCGGAQATLR